ncbi:restriction endonuclease subunit S [Paenibacillus alvei]|uniref:Restriction endonuclease subunit S n=1 Tax=Paenibacillus alvei TaxID=44250 RepID=A0ABT4H3Q2_PAEAL|nr:restriction endonuclease subunit S [Paenibacillus alvei]MCY9763608.1 restriction endonuclease subunit S [Paenibacillus alvei]MCY9770562.1 restriction endonuclease subunit S [Paenibacillus alvei]
MSDKITKSPQIRFAEFTDAWKQVKLKDCFTERSERSAEGELISVTINSGVVKASDLDRKDNSSSDKSNYKVVKVGDIAYNSMRMWQGASGFSPYDGILSPAYTVITPKENSNPKFFAYNFKRHEMISTFQINSQGLTSDTWNLKFPTLSSIKVAIPSYWEQTEIARFFEKLDHQLELHQRELKLLKDTKKSLLQKMFPKDGANVPEIRFAGFTDAWEQRELGKHAKYRRGSFPQPYGKKEWYDGDGAMPFVQVVDVTGHLVLADETKQKISKLAQPKSVFVPKGKVVVTLQGSIGRVAITQYDAFIDRTLLIFEDYEKQTDEHFWAYTIQQKFEVEKQKAPGGTIKTITKEALSSFEINLPKYEEQKKIGGFFAQLDHLITLHQREFNSLKDLKKSMLQQMFV